MNEGYKIVIRSGGKEEQIDPRDIRRLKLLSQVNPEDITIEADVKHPEFMPLDEIVRTLKEIHRSVDNKPIPDEAKRLLHITTTNLDSYVISELKGDQVLVPHYKAIADTGERGYSENIARFADAYGKTITKPITKAKDDRFKVINDPEMTWVGYEMKKGRKDTTVVRSKKISELFRYRNRKNEIINNVFLSAHPRIHVIPTDNATEEAGREVGNVIREIATDSKYTILSKHLKRGMPNKTRRDGILIYFFDPDDFSKAYDKLEELSKRYNGQFSVEADAWFEVVKYIDRPKAHMRFGDINDYSKFKPIGQISYTKILALEKLRGEKFVTKNGEKIRPHEYVERIVSGKRPRKVYRPGGYNRFSW